MNPDEKKAALERLVRAAVEAAVTGPKRIDRWSTKATISHSSLAELRAALDDLGVDWRKVKESVR